MSMKLLHTKEFAMACLYAAKGGATGHRMKFSARNIAKARDLTATICAHQFQVWTYDVI